MSKNREKRTGGVERLMNFHQCFTLNKQHKTQGCQSLGCAQVFSGNSPQVRWPDGALFPHLHKCWGRQRRILCRKVGDASCSGAHASMRAFYTHRSRSVNTLFSCFFFSSTSHNSFTVYLWRQEVIPHFVCHLCTWVENWLRRGKLRLDVRMTNLGAIPPCCYYAPIGCCSSDVATERLIHPVKTGAKTQVVVLDRLLIEGHNVFGRLWANAFYLAFHW